MPQAIAYGDSIAQNMVDATYGALIDRSDSSAGFHAPVPLPPVESIPRGHPVIFSVGWNDTHQTHLPSYRLELVRHLLAIAERAEGQPIILLGMEPLAHQEYWQVPASRVNTANDTLQAALRDARKEGARLGIAFNAAFVDPRRPPVGNREPADGLHYTPRGARELYRRAQEKIEAMLGKQVSLDATPEVMLAEADTVECLSPPNTPGEKPGLSTARKL